MLHFCPWKKVISNCYSIGYHCMVQDLHILDFWQQSAIHFWWCGGQYEKQCRSQLWFQYKDWVRLCSLFTFDQDRLNRESTQLTIVRALQGLGYFNMCTFKGTIRDYADAPVLSAFCIVHWFCILFTYFNNFLWLVSFFSDVNVFLGNEMYSFLNFFHFLFRKN